MFFLPLASIMFSIPKKLGKVLLAFNLIIYKCECGSFFCFSIWNNFQVLLLVALGKILNYFFSRERPPLLKSYSLLCIQKLFLEGWREHMWCWGLKEVIFQFYQFNLSINSVMHKVSIHSTYYCSCLHIILFLNLVLWYFLFKKGKPLWQWPTSPQECSALLLEAQKVEDFGLGSSSLWAS